MTKLPPSATSPARVIDSPKLVIDEVFRKLASYYGSAWLDRWQGIPLDKAKEDWQEALAECTIESVRRALNSMTSPFSPSLPEFRESCRQFHRVQMQRAREEATGPPATWEKASKATMRRIHEIIGKPEKHGHNS